MCCHDEPEAAKEKQNYGQIFRAGGKEKFVWLTWHLFWQVSFPLIVVKSANVPAMEN